MNLKLVKTVGGANGSPQECNTCGSKHFSKSGIAWHCLSCQTYHPTELGFSSLKNSLAHAEKLMKDFDRAINELEIIVKK